MGHAIIQQCHDALVDAIKEDHKLNGEDSTSAATKVDTNDGFIELYVDRYGAQAAVMHADEGKNGRETPNLEAAICAAAPDWWDAEYGDESEVDEGFASYADFLNYMYR